MKLFVFVVLCTFAVAVKAGLNKADAKAAFLAVANTCVAETGATPDDIEAVIKHQPAATREIKCMRACIMKKFNVMNSDGKFDKETALKIVELHTGGDAGKIKVAKEVGDICGDIAVPDDHCEAAELYKMCLFEEARKHGIEVENE